MGARRDPGWDSLWDAVGATEAKDDPADGKRTASAGDTAGAGADDPARGSAAAVAAGTNSASVGVRSSASRVAGGSSAGGPALKTFVVRTDGAARGNPGPASSGAVLIDGSLPGAERPDAPPIATISEYLGIQTNNVAEYTAVVRALALAEELGAQAVDMLLDSKLIVEQLHGRWRVKDAKLIPLHGDAKTRLAHFGRWSARHVPRAQNKQADALCNEAIDRVQAGTGPRVVVTRPS